MKNDTTTPLQIPEDSTNDVLSEILWDGAREMLGKAIEGEVADYIAPSMPTNAMPMPTAWSYAAPVRQNVNFKPASVRFP